MRRALEHRYFAWPPAEDNAVLRLARQRLLGGASARALPTAAAQQGLIQMVRDFCDQSDATCNDCRLPALVRDWRDGGAGSKSNRSYRTRTKPMKKLIVCGAINVRASGHTSPFRERSGSARAAGPILRGL